MKRRKYLVCTVIGSLLILLTAFIVTNRRPTRSIEWSSPIVIVNGTGNVDPFAFEDSDGLIHLFWASNLHENYDIYEKTYDGVNWSEARTLTISASVDREPVALEDHEGRIRLFFSSNRSGKFMIYEMTFNQGTWSSPAQVPHKFPEYWNHTAEICIPGFTHPSAFEDENGTIYLFFCSFVGATENINELFMMVNDGTGWADQTLVGGNGYDPSALKDPEGNILTYCTGTGMWGPTPSIVEWAHDGVSWTSRAIGTSIPQDPWLNTYPSASQDSKGNIRLFYSGVVWNETWDQWRKEERIYEQLKTPSSDWSRPVEITEGIMPSAFQSHEEAFYLFFTRGGTIYLMKGNELH